MTLSFYNLSREVILFNIRYKKGIVSKQGRAWQFVILYPRLKDFHFLFWYTLHDSLCLSAILLSEFYKIDRRQYDRRKTRLQCQVGYVGAYIRKCYCRSIDRHKIRRPEILVYILIQLKQEYHFQQDAKLCICKVYTEAHPKFFGIFFRKEMSYDTVQNFV